MPRKPSRKSRGIRLRSALAIAATVMVLVLFVGSKHWLSVDSLRAHRDALLQFVAGRYWESLMLVGGITVALVAASVPATAALMLLSGLLFGRWVGSAVMVLTTTLGAILAMLAVRYLAQDFVRGHVRRYPKARRMVAAIKRDESSYLLFLRFMPGFPFWLANILFGLTEVSALRFLLVTLVGIVPDAIVYCNIGANLARVKSAHDLLSPGTIGALTLLALLALVPVAIQKLKRRGVLHTGRPSHRGP